LDLVGTPITSLPDNLTVGGDLDLVGTPITSLPDNLTVGGYLVLVGTPITSLPDNLMVRGDLNLRGTNITSFPDNLTVGESLYLRGTNITSLPDNLTVGGDLDLRNTPITSLPDNLTVGGWLDLSGTPIDHLPDNLTVGGWLDLKGTNITSLPDNLVIGGRVWCDRTITNPNHYTELQHGDYLEGKYLYADGILTHIKKHKVMGEYTYYLGKISGKNVISDGTHYAHCEDFHKGIEDIRFKRVEDRGMDIYKGLTVDSIIPKDDAITMYRVITGACRQGTETFVNGLGELKDAYTIREMIELTKGQYGSEVFREFFG
jgi:hypothetical protein